MQLGKKKKHDFRLGFRKIQRKFQKIYKFQGLERNPNQDEENREEIHAKRGVLGLALALGLGLGGENEKTRNMENKKWRGLSVISPLLRKTDI